jgi:hypothetical protein
MAGATGSECIARTATFSRHAARSGRVVPVLSPIAMTAERHAGRTSGSTNGRCGQRRGVRCKATVTAGRKCTPSCRSKHPGSLRHGSGWPNRPRYGSCNERRAGARRARHRAPAGPPERACGAVSFHLMVASAGAEGVSSSSVGRQVTVSRTSTEVLSSKLSLRRPATSTDPSTPS